MTKITTEYCKKFIVDFHRKNPNIEMTRFRISNTPTSEESELLADLLNEKNWKRLFKRLPEEDENYIYIDGENVNKYAEPQSKVKFSDIKFVRGFEMIKSDGQIAYLVLEMKDGKLYLGDYIGD